MSKTLILVAEVESELARVAQVLAGVADLALTVAGPGEVDLAKYDVSDVEAPTLITATGAVQRHGAIVRALARMQPGAGLFGPGDALAASQCDAWLDFCDLQLRPLLAPVVRACAAGHAVNKIQKKVDALVPVLEALERKCAEDTWLVAQRPSVADFAVAIALDGLFEHVLDEEARSARLGNVFRWWLTVHHQPAVLTALGQPTVLSSALGASSTPAAAGAASGATASAASAVTVPQAATHAQRPGPALANPVWSRRRVRVVDVLAAGKAIAGQTITVSGWARTSRAAGAALLFIALSDGSCAAPLQVVVEAGRCSDHAQLADDVSVSAAVTLTGVVVESPAKGQAVELHAVSGRVIGKAPAAEYPLAKKRHTLEYLRSMLHLRPRTNTIAAVTRVRNALAFATHRFLQERGFLYIHTPIITCADCEGAGEQFNVTTLLPADVKGDLAREKDGSIAYSKDFFSRQASLTVSGQLQVEGFACSMSDVYTFGPTFRAENSHTSRHLAEFWMMEPEMAFADLKDDMALATDYLKYCTAYVLQNCVEDLKFFEKQFEAGLLGRLQNVVEKEFVHITYTEAIEMLTQPKVLKKAKFEVVPTWGIDMGSEHERYLTEQVFKCPVIVTDYPKDIKAFYMYLNEDGKTVAAMDVLVPKIGELMGGSQREHRLDVLHARMDEVGVDKEELSWYADLRRYGSVPHAGFGIGFERLVMYVTGLDNIRDVIPYPRYPGHAEG